jgi:glutathione synthase/RimK-type ligase-like ATP-grasp enzyme
MATVQSGAREEPPSGAMDCARGMGRIVTDAIQDAFERARELESQGHNELARVAYAGVIARSPGHAGALNALGMLLYRTGSRKAAQIAFSQAAQANPGNVASHINLAYTLVFESRFLEARENYARALELEHENRLAHQGMAYVLSELGDEEGAQKHREAGFVEPVLHGTYRGQGDPVCVLLLCSLYGGTVSTAQFLDDRIFLTTTIVVELFEGALPPHHVAFNAIGDADRCAPALERAAEILASTSAPIINAPAAVLATRRLDNARRLAATGGVRAPRIASMGRDEILASDDLAYPLLLRAPGFHTGRFFERVERRDELEAAVARLPGGELLAIEYLDGRGADGKYRKYRAIIVDGELYPLHLAISSDWKVHYGTADMRDPQHQAEEQRFLQDMRGTLGPKTIAALENIASALGLDYGGIDFGVDAEGRILLYEANATMTVVVPEAHEAAYRRLPAERIIVEVIKMLAKRASGVKGR